MRVKLEGVDRTTGELFRVSQQVGEKVILKVQSDRREDEGVVIVIEDNDGYLTATIDGDIDIEV